MSVRLVLSNKLRSRPKLTRKESLKIRYSLATTAAMLTLIALMIPLYSSQSVLALLTANRALLLMTQVLAIRTSSLATLRVVQEMRLAMSQ